MKCKHICTYEQMVYCSFMHDRNEYNTIMKCVCVCESVIAFVCVKGACNVEGGG